MVWSCGEERKKDLVRKCMYIKMDVARPRGRTRKTWLEMVKNDMKGLGSASVDALDHYAWRRKIVGDTC